MLCQALTAAGAHNTACWQEAAEYSDHLEAYLVARGAAQPLQLLRRLAQKGDLLWGTLEIAELGEAVDPLDFKQWAEAQEARLLAANSTSLHRAGRSGGGGRQLWQASPAHFMVDVSPSQLRSLRRRFRPSGRQLGQATSDLVVGASRTRLRNRRRKFRAAGRQLQQATAGPKPTPASPAKARPRSPPAKAASPAKPSRPKSPRPATLPVKSPRLGRLPTPTTSQKQPSASPKRPPPSPRRPKATSARRSPRRPTLSHKQPRPATPVKRSPPARATSPAPRSPPPRPGPKASPQKPSPVRAAPSPTPPPRSPPISPPPSPSPTPTPPPPGPTTPAIDLNDPFDQLVDWAGRVSALGGSLTFLTSADPTSMAGRRLAQAPAARTAASDAGQGGATGADVGGGRQLRQATNGTSAALQNVGFDWFAPRSIGVVFHVLQFRDEDGVLQPQQAYADGDRPARLLLSVINTLYQYSGTNVQFYLKEYRTDTTQYPYLDFKTQDTWQQCGNAQIGCSCRLCLRNVDSRRYINIYVAGSQAFPGFTSASGAVTTSSPGFLDLCDWAFRSNYTLDWVPARTPLTQHVWLLFDFLDPLSQNNAGTYHLGATTLAHEFAHMLGLRHTFGPKGECADMDLVADTPPDKQGAWQQDPAAAAVLDAVCENLSLFGRLPSRQQLAAFDSCPGDKYGDNVFNLMNYTPAGCWVLLSRGQVRQLQQRTTDYQPLLGVAG